VGAWHDVDPGSNPGFLRQQNSLRTRSWREFRSTYSTALRPGENGNIAQMINVLQSMILTDKEKMIVTPTYYVFELYTVHHDATLLPANCMRPITRSAGRRSAVSASVSATRQARSMSRFAISI